MQPFPKQMRYQAALLPDGSFPRGSALRPQAAFGTKRNHAAQRDAVMTQNPPQYDFESPKDFAERHGVAKRHVLRAVAAGIFPVVRFGKRIRIDVENLPADYADYIMGDFITRSGPQRECFVYFIGPVGGPFKIGVALDPNHRLTTLQTSHWEELLVHATVSGGPLLETQYHKRFKEYRIRGEWFSPHPDILAEIERLAGQAA